MEGGSEKLFLHRHPPVGSTDSKNQFNELIKSL